MSKLLTWLKSLFTHPKEETIQMTDQVVEVQPVAAEPTTSAVAEQTAPSDADILLTRIKELLVKVGHNVEPVFDEVVALAKKLV